MKRNILVIAAILFIAGGLYFAFGRTGKAPEYQALPDFSQPAAQEQTSSSTEADKPPAESRQPASGAMPSKQFSGGEAEAPGPDIQVWEVSYANGEFAPKVLDIKKGDYVFFKNKSTVDFWPASNPHPAHTGYSGFDAKAPIAPGGKFQFQFTKAGAWGFHDHLNPGAAGTINVAE